MPDPGKNTAEPSPFTIGRIAVVEEDRSVAEMLHTFFRVMEIQAVVIAPGEEPADAVAASVCRVSPQAVVLGGDLPNLRALDIARAIRAADPVLPIVLTTRDPGGALPLKGLTIARRPTERFEELLDLLEVVLDTEG